MRNRSNVLMRHAIMLAKDSVPSTPVTAITERSILTHPLLLSDLFALLNLARKFI